MRRFAITLLALAALLPAAAQKKLDQLEIFRQEYPRAGYFRIAEFVIRTDYKEQYGKYKEWARRMSDLSGIMGKTEYEELLRDNPHEQIYDWFRRFKKDYPEKFVVVHMNGRGRIPNYRIDKFSAAHWLYFEGCDIKTDLPAEGGPGYEKRVWIEVEDPSRFRKDNGMRMNMPDDIVLVRRHADGTFDWNAAEQVRLVAIDGNHIQIDRAMFGTRAIRFDAGKTYAAPHVMGGPWETTRNMVWYYNLSPECPRDRNGKTCADLLVEEFGANFAKGGRWATFDGVQFDVMMSIPTTGYHERRKALGERADCNMDGKQDDGIFNGVESFGLGNYEFLTRLRKAVGPDKILAADGREQGCQKAGNGQLSGVEMEGLPEQRPYGWVTWSTVMNTLDFWKGCTADPKFNYGAFRYNNPDKLPTDVLMRYYRLGFAATCFTDSFILAGSWMHPRDLPELRQVFPLGEDEAITGWLGKPAGETLHLAASAPDLMGGAGNPVGKKALAVSQTAPYVAADRESTFATTAFNAAGNLVVSPAGNREIFGFEVRNVPYPSQGAYLEVTMRSSEASKVYPAGYNRHMHISANGQGERYKIQLSPVGDDWFTYRFYFCNAWDPMTQQDIVFNPGGEKTIALRLILRDADRPVEISKITVHNAPEVVERRFERGTVIANLSNEEYRSAELDVTVPAKDALFIRKNK